MSLIILSDTTRFLYNRLMKAETELKNMERKLLLEKIIERNLYNLWVDLDKNEFEKESKIAHFNWTAKQQEVLILERGVNSTRQRLMANACKSQEL